MDCKQIQPELQAYLDKELLDIDSSNVGEHLRSCPSCQAAVHKLKDVSNLLRDIQVVEVRSDYLSRMESRLERNRSLEIRYTRFAAAVAAVILISMGAFFIFSSGTLFDNSLKFVNSDSEDKYISISEQVKILLAPRSEVALTAGSNTSYGTLKLRRGKVTIAISSPLNVPLSIQTGVDSFEVSEGAIELCLLEVVPNGHKADKDGPDKKGLLVSYY